MVGAMMMMCSCWFIRIGTWTSLIFRTNTAECERIERTKYTYLQRKDHTFIWEISPNAYTQSIDQWKLGKWGKTKENEKRK